MKLMLRVLAIIEISSCYRFILLEVYDIRLRINNVVVRFMLIPRPLISYDGDRNNK